MTWACSDKDDPTSGSHGQAGETSHGGDPSEGGQSPQGGHSGTAGSAGHGGSAGHAGTAAGGSGGAQGGSENVGGGGDNAGGINGHCEDGVPVPPDGGGGDGNGGAGGDSYGQCEASLASLCSSSECPLYGGGGVGNLATGCKVTGGDGDQVCAVAFRSSCGGYSIRLENEYDSAVMTVWHFDQEKKLVGAVREPRTLTACAASFYGKTCEQTGPAIDLCDVEAGSCEHALAEYTLEEITRVEDVPTSMFGGVYRNDCGGLTAVRAGEHLNTRFYSFDAAGHLVGVLSRGYSALCDDGSVRLGDRYGQYCAPDTSQPVDCGQGAGGCTQ